MIHSTIGLVHTICATIALLTGTFVLLTTKGNRLHVRVGYVYVISMLVMNFTGFGIYHLFGGFGIFHVMILVSLFALFGGMYPVLFRNKVKNWYLQHLEVMSWSIVGLYVQKSAIVYHLRRIKVSHPCRVKVSHLRRVKVSH